MPKILDLRKKSAKISRVPPQKTREEVRVEKNSVKLLRYSEPITAPKSTLNKPRISWEAPSFYYNPQKRYLSLLIAALLSGATAMLIFKYDILTSIFLILTSLVLILYGNKKPTTSKITVGQSGVSIDDIIYYYKDLKSFWIEYDPRGQKELSIESAKWYLPYIKVLLENQNPIEVRSLIINFLPEKEHENSLVDHIGRRLGL